MTAERLPGLRGRSDEHARLDRVLENVRGGQSAVLVIRGEAGVGKTALLHHCARHAAGFRVAWIAGVESEMELPFAGLHQLCAPMLGHLGALPEPQQAALGVALGLSSGSAPDRFLVALAALSLLAEVAAERPLLCLVDDAQWLDAVSGQVLGFVARRLLAESMAIVFAVREPSDERELVGLPELALQGLPEEDARALLATVLPGRIDESVRDRLVAETRGNALAILELPRALAAANLPGGFGLDGAGSSPGHIEESFLRRLEALPHDARMLLLVAAAEPVDDPLLVWRAAEELGIASAQAAAEPAEGLLAIGERVRFRHPLVRSAVYRSATPQDRRRVHLALAKATDARVDPDRRAWHMAQATTAPDERVAAELARSAARAQARGGLGAAAAFQERAATLSPEPSRRATRMLAAATAKRDAGALDAALRLLGAAHPEPLDGLGRARVAMLHGQIAFDQFRSDEAARYLADAAGRLEPVAAGLARKTQLEALGAPMWTGARDAAAGDGRPRAGAVVGRRGQRQHGRLGGVGRRCVAGPDRSPRAVRARQRRPGAAAVRARHGRLGPRAGRRPDQVRAGAGRGAQDRGGDRQPLDLLHRDGRRGLARSGGNGGNADRGDDARGAPARPRGQLRGVRQRDAPQRPRAPRRGARRRSLRLRPRS